MKYNLIDKGRTFDRPTEQILFNRGIDPDDFLHYMNTSDADINSPLMFGEDGMKLAAKMFMQAVSTEKKVLVIVDADCDGFTSSAILINYSYDCFPAWTTNNVSYYMHEGKQHGLYQEIVDLAIEGGFGLVICPDAASNDYDMHKQLADDGIDVLILDHHEAPKVSEYAVTINNQLSNYPNKHLAGAGVTWQFCRYMDSLTGNEYADDYLDLVALGNDADMMSLHSFETKRLIEKGLEQLKNPFFIGIREKNRFSLGDVLTPIGVAFYVSPFVNAVVRSGTTKEKFLLFESMLKFKAYNEILSNKRGHNEGEMERIIDQALRMVTNVKKRQKVSQDNGMALLKGLIETDNMLEHKALIFILEPGQIHKNIAGLVANKFINEYQRPCCVLTKVEKTNEDGTTSISYQGSSRGYPKSGVENFKDVCEESGLAIYAQGHQNAFGLGIKAENLEEFIKYIDIEFKDIAAEPCFAVDYILNKQEVTRALIGEISSLQNLWGADMETSLIALKGIRVTEDMAHLMGNRGKTMKFIFPSGVEAVKFFLVEGEFDSFLKPGGYVEVDMICKCSINSYDNSPQMIVDEYEIVDYSNFYF